MLNSRHEGRSAGSDISLRRGCDPVACLLSHHQSWQILGRSLRNSESHPLSVMPVDRFPLQSTVERVKISIRNTKTTEIQFSRTGQKPSGTLNRTHTLWFTDHPHPRSRKRRNSGGSHGPDQTSPSGCVPRVSLFVRTPISDLQLQSGPWRSAGGRKWESEC